MRLRYFHIEDLPPLNNLSVTFERPNRDDLPLETQACTIHFVVGVNGVGKSRFLVNLAKTVLSIESQNRPECPATLAYDLGENDQARTVLFHAPRCEDGSVGEPILIEFDTCLPEDTDWASYAAFDWSPVFAVLRESPGTKPEGVRSGDRLNEWGSGTVPGLLPYLLAYTSGVTEYWQDAFAPRLSNIDDDTIEKYLVELDPEAARLPGWNMRQEVESGLSQGLFSTTDEAKKLLIESKSVGQTTYRSSNVGQLVGPEELSLAVLAVTLHHAAQELNIGSFRANEDAQEAYLNRIRVAMTEKTPMKGLRGVLNEVGWLWPVTIRLELTTEAPPTMSLAQRKAWERAVTIALRRPGSEGCFYLCDVNTFPDNEGMSTARALTEALGGSEDAPAFRIFRTLLTWRRLGILVDTSITFQRLDDPDLLLYDWLSDGQKMLLSRIALFYLLHDEGLADTLLILDEPETHFNDLWKRRIIDMLYESLRNTSTDVLISTHSSIALSDVFAEEIELLDIDPETRQTRAQQVLTPTFGADPSEIMVFVFNAPDSIGQRAQEVLDRWVSSSETDIPTLERMIRKTGGGYYRSELRARLRALLVQRDGGKTSGAPLA
jgi:hypothetical protein